MLKQVARISTSAVPTTTLNAATRFAFTGGDTPGTCLRHWRAYYLPCRFGYRGCMRGHLGLIMHFPCQSLFEPRGTYLCTPRAPLPTCAPFGRWDLHISGTSYHPQHSKWVCLQWWRRTSDTLRRSPNESSPLSFWLSQWYPWTGGDDKSAISVTISPRCDKSLAYLCTPRDPLPTCAPFGRWDLHISGTSYRRQRNKWVCLQWWRRTWHTSA